MSNKIIPLSFDLAFKKVFGDNDNIERLEAFLSLYLNIPIEDLKGNVTVIDNEKRLKQKDDKKQYVDILLKLELITGNEKINIEINRGKKNQGLIDRNISYIAGIYSGQLKRKEDYSLIEPVLQINFNESQMSENNKIIDKYYIMNEDKHKLTNKFQIHHINIEKCYDIWYHKNVNKYDAYEREIIKIGALLKSETKETFVKCLEEIKMNEEVKKDIKSTVYDLSEEEELLIYYDREQHERAVMNSAFSELRSAKKELEDYKKNMKNELEKSKQEMQKEIKNAKENGIKERNVELAKKMLADNIDIDFISKYTNLSIEELNYLKNEH